MTYEQVGCYIFLLCIAWQADPPCTIPSDTNLQATLLKLPVSKWRKISVGVLVPWEAAPNKRLVQPRLQREYEYLAKRIDEASTAGSVGGKASAEARRLAAEARAAEVQRPFNDRSTTVDIPLERPFNDRCHSASSGIQAPYPNPNPYPNPSRPVLPPNVAASAPKPDEQHDENFVVAAIQRATHRQLGSRDRMALTEICVEIEAAPMPVIEGTARPWPEVFERAVRFSLPIMQNPAPVQLAGFARTAAMNTINTHQWPGNEVKTTKPKPKTVWDELEKESA